MGLFGLNGSTLYLDYLESTKPMLKGWLQEIFLLKVHFFQKKLHFGQFSEPIIWRSQIDQNKIHYLSTFIVPILHKTAKNPMLIVCQAEKSYSQVAKKSVFFV